MKRESLQTRPPAWVVVTREGEPLYEDGRVCTYATERAAASEASWLNGMHGAGSYSPDYWDGSLIDEEDGALQERLCTPHSRKIREAERRVRERARRFVASRKRKVRRIRL